MDRRISNHLWNAYSFNGDWRITHKHDNGTFNSQHDCCSFGNYREYSMRPLLRILILVLFLALYIFLVVAEIIEPLTFGENGKAILSAGFNASKEVAKGFVRA